MSIYNRGKSNDKNQDGKAKTNKPQHVKIDDGNIVISKEIRVDITKQPEDTYGRKAYKVSIVALFITALVFACNGLIYWQTKRSVDETKKQFESTHFPYITHEYSTMSLIDYGVKRSIKFGIVLKNSGEQVARIITLKNKIEINDDSIITDFTYPLFNKQNEQPIFIVPHDTLPYAYGSYSPLSVEDSIAINEHRRFLFAYGEISYVTYTLPDDTFTYQYSYRIIPSPVFIPNHSHSNFRETINNNDILKNGKPM